MQLLEDGRPTRANFPGRNERSQSGGPPGGKGERSGEQIRKNSRHVSCRQTNRLKYSTFRLPGQSNGIGILTQPESFPTDGSLCLRNQIRYNSLMKVNADIRSDALTQLKKAQQMIAEGRKELAAANKKITLAQKLIDESADALRDTPVDRSYADRPR